MNKTYRSPMVINLVRNLLTKIPTVKRGTYDRADPTAYSFGRITHDNVDIEYHDSTWSVVIWVKKPGEKLTELEYYPSFGGDDPYVTIEDMPEHFLAFIHKLSSGMKNAHTDEETMTAEEYYMDQLFC